MPLDKNILHKKIAGIPVPVLAVGGGIAAIVLYRKFGGGGAASGGATNPATSDGASPSDYSQGAASTGAASDYSSGSTDSGGGGGYSGSGDYVSGGGGAFIPANAPSVVPQAISNVWTPISGSWRPTWSPTWRPTWTPTWRPSPRPRTRPVISNHTQMGFTPQSPRPESGTKRPRIRPRVGGR